MVRLARRSWRIISVGHESLLSRETRERGASSLPECGEMLKPPTTSCRLFLATPDRLRQCPFPPFRVSSSRSTASSVMSVGQP